MPMSAVVTQRPPTKKRVTFVHNQYNSPLDLYSAQEVAETLHRHTRVLSNGAVGWAQFKMIDIFSIRSRQVLIS